MAVKQRPARWPLYALAALFLVLVLALVGWFIWGGKGDPATPAADPSGEWPAQVGDHLVDAQPETLVSLSPMVTEALLDLPGSGRLRAITEYCDGRESGLPTVGTPLLPRIEEIISLAPTYVLCQTPLTDTVKNQLEQAGIRVITLTTPTDLSGLRQFYGELGALLGGNVTGRALGYGVIDRMASTLGLYSAATGKTATALLLPDLSGLAATADTVEWALLGNLFSHPLPEATGWLAEAGELNDDDPANDLAQVLAADPDLLLVPDTVSPDEVSAALGNLRAVQNGAVIYYNSRLVETLSPRLVFTLADAAAFAYPTLTPPAAKSTT